MITFLFAVLLLLCAINGLCLFGLPKHDPATPRPPRWIGFALWAAGVVGLAALLFSSAPARPGLAQNPQNPTPAAELFSRGNHTP